MALDQCVQDILCSLSAGVRNAFVSILRTYITQIDVSIAAYEAKLVYLNILAVPPQALNEIAQTALNQVRNVTRLVPFSVIQECTDYNQITGAVQTTLDDLSSNAQILTNDLQRILSLRDEVEAVIIDLRRVRDLYVEVLSVTDACD